MHPSFKFPRILKRSRLLAVVFGAAVAAMLPVAAFAWISWSGIDPVLQLSTGQQVNIWVEWPTEQTCVMDKTIEVEVTTPRNVKAQVLSESTQDFGCRIITTQTEVDRGLWSSQVLKVEADVDSREDFPVNLRVTIDGEDEQVIRGRSNGRIS